MFFGVIKLKQNGRLDETWKFCWLGILTMSDQLKEKLWIYHRHTFYTDIGWHKLGWHWFSAISENQNGRHSQFFRLYFRPITAMPFKLSSPDLTCRWVIIIVLVFDLISLLVNFSCELGQIMTRYDFLWARWVILRNFQPDLNLT